MKKFYGFLATMLITLAIGIAGGIETELISLCRGLVIIIPAMLMSFILLIKAGAFDNEGE